jgi:hypothetical protein
MACGDHLPTSIPAALGKMPLLGLEDLCIMVNVEAVRGAGALSVRWVSLLASCRKQDA